VLNPNDWKLVRMALPGIAGLRDAAAIAARLHELEAEAREPVVFRLVGDDGAEGLLYEIGRGDDVRTVTSRLRGVWAVWCMLDDPGEPFSPVHLTKPGALAPVASVRKMIRKQAAEQFEAWGQLDLRAAALSCSTHGDVVRMQLPGNAPRFVTR
jgi:hypothetical protein